MRCCKVFDSQCHSLPTQKRVSVAGFTERFSQLANRLLTVSALAQQWSVGRGLERISEN